MHERTGFNKNGIIIIGQKIVFVLLLLHWQYHPTASVDSVELLHIAL